MGLKQSFCGILVKVANGQMITSKGKVKLPIIIAKQEIVVECQIIPQLSHNLILGCQFLHKHQAIIDFTRLKPIIKLNLTDPGVPKLYTIEKTKIPARSQCFIECKMSQNPQCKVAISNLSNRELFEEHGV
jgi:hypothetical protein